MDEKRRATTFRTSKGTIVSVEYPDIYIQPGFVLPADVTNPSEMRGALREQLRHYEQLDFRAPDDQRSWPGFSSTGSLIQVVLPASVRSMIPYKDHLLVATGASGGIYKLPEKELVYQYPKANILFPYAYEEAWVNKYVPGNNLDRVVFGGTGAVHRVNPDFSVDRLVFYEQADHPFLEVAALALRDVTEEELYVKVWCGALYRVNVRNLTSTRIADRPVAGRSIGGRGATFYGGNLYTPAQDNHVTSMGLWQYNPTTGVWMRIISDKRFLSLHQGWTYGVLLGRDAVRMFITVTSNFAAFEDNIAPQIGPLGESDGVSLSGDLTLTAYNGVLWGVRSGTLITALRSTCWNPMSLEWWAGKLAVGYNGPNYLTERDMAGGAVEFLPTSSLIGPLAPARANIWVNEAITHDTNSYPVLVSGWTRGALGFIANAAGTLTIQIDQLGDGWWQTYDAVAINANELTTYKFASLDFERARISYSVDATITAKVRVM